VVALWSGTAIDEQVAENDGVIITVRGKEKYVILPMEEYNQLRELELDAAIQESKKDIESGRFFFRWNRRASFPD
jgi:prevent-host-death family protein